MLFGSRTGIALPRIRRREKPREVRLHRSPFLSQGAQVVMITEPCVLLSALGMLAVETRGPQCRDPTTASR